MRGQGLRAMLSLTQLAHAPCPLIRKPSETNPPRMAGQGLRAMLSLTQLAHAPCPAIRNPSETTIQSLQPTA